MIQIMSATEELTRLCAELPPEKVAQILNYARSVQAAPEAVPLEEFDPQNEDDAAWERIIDDPRPRPKLEAFLAKAMAEGESTPLEGNL
jgi:hypothetical protein